MNRGRWRSDRDASNPGTTVELDEQRLYELRLPDGGEGLFVLSLPEPPSPDISLFDGRR